ncbi:hypothetical protein WOLCODRAFT_77408 [Wolfiporia cocos MD-104 SS10]|uniref:DUF6533 domain-containing protein n=1 Tax=Wolfiporia cocos (strain MD-104) TaxID=742152 RepID=A0A2H3K3V7_WOLCO|nr:hypothetical protein WOLCODRAFT_77408 [Wolfiporia cocos MD-104 SS10]
MSTVLLFYDYALTLEQEIQLIWKAPRRGSFAIFALNRLVMFLMALISAMGFCYSMPQAISNCQQYLIIVACAVWAGKQTERRVMFAHPIFTVFSALRMYAVCNRSWLLSAVTLVLGLAPAVANIVSKEILLEL